MPEKLVIIGSGAAAWTAAVYAARANLRPLLYEGAITEENRVRGTLPLGQLNWTTEVEDFPGFPEGVMGPDLVLRMREQAERHGTRIVTEDITSLDLSRRPFELSDSLGQSFSAHAVVLATGATIRRLDLESARRFQDRGLCAVAIDDGSLPRFRNRPVLIVGGGDSAVDTALWMTRYSAPVYLVHRGPNLRAAARLAEPALAHPKIVAIANSAVAEVLGDDAKGVTGVRLRDRITGAETVIQTSGLFPLIGRDPNAALVRGQVELDAGGYVVLKRPPRTATSVEGVFAAGEVADPIYRKAVTAAAMGCHAALDAERWLEARGID